LIWFYTASTGWQSSAIRATIMMSIVVGGWALKRPGNLLNSLAGAAFIILLWEPQQLFQASFQLSFLVVLSIALLLPPLEKLRDRILRTDPLRPAELLPRWQRICRTVLRWSMTAAATSLAAWLGAWPLTAYYFHLFSPVTLLANVMIVPLASAALASCLGSLLCGAWFPWATELFNNGAWFWMWLMMGISHWSANLPGAYFFVPPPVLADFAIYYGTLFGALSGWLFHIKRRAWLVAGLVMVAGYYVFRWQDAQRSVTITAIPLNGGSGVYCDAPGRRNDVLADCGNTNSVEFILKPFLQAQGVNSLQSLLLTHGDLRNVGGAEPLCDAIRVKEIVTSDLRFRSSSYRQILQDLPSRHEAWRTISRGDRVGNWTVLHPEKDDAYSQADDGCVVLLGEFFGTRILLLSDLGQTGQNALLEREKDLRADIVVSGLPREGEPLRNALLDAIQPKAIVIVDSDYPATTRAKPELRKRLARRNIPVIYTREVGAVKINANKHGWALLDSRGRELLSGANAHGPLTTSHEEGSGAPDGP
jgi:competence protein ComEC